MNNDENKTTNNIPPDLIYHPLELEKLLDDTSVPLSDDEMQAMSAYFDSENFRHEEEILLINE